MTETPYSSKPRNGGADDQAGLSGLFRTWLRQALRGKSESSWRDTIEELIEENGDADTQVALHERRLLANILELKDLTAYDVMIPRADIVAVDLQTPPDELLQLLSKKAHSRLPVYRESLDDVVGMVHMKDVVARLAQGQGFTLQELLRDVLIVAPSMPALDLLLEMREGRRHMALVVDEFGGIDGLITIEDLVEEIVGEIEDEHEAETQPRMVDRPDGSWLADARLPIETFEERAGPVLDDDERDDIDTLGGMVFALAGRVPLRGELLIHPAGLEIEVVDADPRRIKRLRVRRIERQNGEDRPPERA